MNLKIGSTVVPDKVYTYNEIMKHIHMQLRDKQRTKTGKHGRKDK